MRILYLNVNDFFGDSSIKKWYTVKYCRKDRLNKIISNLLIKKIQNELYDMIFLSEIDPHSEATLEFKEKMEDNNYKYILPNAVNHEDDIRKSIYSITVAFIKKEFLEEWLNNKKSNASMEKWLHICEIGGTSNNKMLIAGVHATEGVLKDLANTKKYNEDFIIFGDFNTNSKKEESEEKFKEIVKNLSAEEVVDIEEKNTFRGKTKIDRVITKNVKGVKLSIDESYYIDGLSDHAALIIDIPDNIWKTIESF